MTHNIYAEAPATQGTTAEPLPQLFTNPIKNIFNSCLVIPVLCLSYLIVISMFQRMFEILLSNATYHIWLGGNYSACFLCNTVIALPHKLLVALSRKTEFNLHCMKN